MQLGMHFLHARLLMQELSTFLISEAFGKIKVKNSNGL